MGSVFAREGWLIGISIDGPEAVNDTYRTWPDGTATSRTVLGGISLLNAAGVEWNAMATVNSANVCRPEEFYDFMKELGTRFIQFTPIAERRRSDGALAHSRQPGDFTPESISPAQWGDFLCRVFDRWRAGDIGKVFVQVFDATLAGYLSADPGTCIFSRRCGMNPVIEANGDIYSCDHFVFDPFRIGNINSDTFHTIIGRMQRFGDAKCSELPEECVKCRFLRLCNGECPKNRFASDKAETSRNHFCEGYRRFFSYTEPFMRRAADAILRSSR